MAITLTRLPGLDNDLFAGTDENYTNGVRIAIYCR